MDTEVINNITDETKVKQLGYVSYTLPDTLSQTSAYYGIIFVATRPCSVVGISEVHTVAGSDAGAVTVLVERLTGTTAPGSGTSLMTSTFNLKGTANTTQYAGIRGGTSLISKTGLNIGDRLALKVSGTLTALKGVCVTVELTQ